MAYVLNITHDRSGENWDIPLEPARTLDETIRAGLLAFRDESKKRKGRCIGILRIVEPGKYGHQEVWRWRSVESPIGRMVYGEAGSNYEATKEQESAR